MSWRGSTGHLDANVPDYQKMLQGRYPPSTSGWSSTPSNYGSYTSSRPPAHGGSYVHSRQNSFSGSSTHQGYSGTYQPSKYSLKSETAYNVASDFKTLQAENANFNTDNGFDKSYGIVSREFDLEPYRSSSQRNTDYSSDSGRGRATQRAVPDYSSDSGRARVTQRTVPDYSSDSGTSFRHQRKKSNEFELEIPSPETSRSRSRSQNNEDFSSPVKSHFPVSDYLKLSDNHSTFNSRGQGHGSHDNLAVYNQRSRVKNIEQPAQDQDVSELESNPTRDSSPRFEDTSPRLSNNGHEHDNDSSGQNIDDVNASLSSHFMSPPLYKGDIGDTTLVHRDIKPARGRGSDLTHWQRSQRESPPTVTEHKHQTSHHHRHHQQHTSQESYPDISHDTYDRYDHDKPRRRHDSPDTSPRQHTTSDQMNHIRSAADAIIRDKDAIIEQLRLQINSLEDTTKEYENKLRRSLMNRGGNSADTTATHGKMQEMEYRSAELRTELAKCKLQKDTEIEDLEIKLGGVEHEVVQLKAALRKTQPNAADMKDKLAIRDEEICDWKMKYSQMSDSHEGLKDKMEGLERYLADLPTIEEFNTNTQQLKSYRDDNDLKMGQITDLEERLSDTTQELSERETTIKELEGKQQQLGDKLRAITLEIRHIKTEGEGRALMQAQEELAETLEIKDRVTLDLEKAKKLLEMNHRRLRQLEVKYQTDQRQVSERLQQEEESVMALREEGRLKEQQVAKLKKSLKDFASKNQDLMDECLILKEQLKNFEQTSADDNQKLQRRFLKEMGLCFTELNSVVQICVERAEGKEPNISLLLGMNSSPAMDGEVEGGAAGGAKREEQTLKHWFSKLKDLRAQVEKIRKMICNKYAEEMGDNLNCSTQ